MLRHNFICSTQLTSSFKPSNSRCSSPLRRSEPSNLSVNDCTSDSFWFTTSSRLFLSANNVSTYTRIFFFFSWTKHQVIRIVVYIVLPARPRSQSSPGHPHANDVTVTLTCLCPLASSCFEPTTQYSQRILKSSSNTRRQHRRWRNNFGGPDIPGKAAHIGVY